MLRTSIALALILAMLPLQPAAGQDEQVAAEAPDAAPAAEQEAELAADSGEEETDAEEVDDSDLDEQVYEEDDDDFVPSEEIPADEPIPFPSNI